MTTERVKLTSTQATLVREALLRFEDNAESSSDLEYYPPSHHVVEDLVNDILEVIR